MKTTLESLVMELLKGIINFNLEMIPFEPIYPTFQVLLHFKTPNFPDNSVFNAANKNKL